MFKNVTYGFVFLSAMFLFNGAAFAQDTATLDQVYQAAHAGKMDEAQRLMDQVLNDHPNSGKAHYVEAELLAKQGQMGRADTELKNAERLNPSLSFAKPQAVQDLKNIIYSNNRASQAPTGSYQTQQGNSFPWALVLLGIAAIAIITLIMKSVTSRNSSAIQGGYPQGVQNGFGSPQQPYAGGMGQMGSTGGIGSGIMGGLATGAAVGVGMVAGEALAHHFMDGGRSDTGNMAPVTSSGGTSSDNMGGADFGIADNSSWDDNAGLVDVGSDVSGSDWS
jgi:hypothetical protein